MTDPLRILFVDDDANALRALEHDLALGVDGWELEFADAPGAALERISPGAFHAVVSAMAMRDMTGVELLRRARERDGATLRLLHSPRSEMSAIVRAIGPVHQVLEKPPSSEDLTRALGACGALHERLGCAPLRELVASVQSLPSLPSLYLELVRAIEEERPIDDIAAIIEQDPAMTVKLLQLVNSSFFSIASECDTVARAVVLLGTETVQGLLLGAKVFDAFQAGGDQLAWLWVKSCDTAAFARAFGRLERIGAGEMAQLAVAAMLHEAGLLLLLRHARPLFDAIGAGAGTEPRAADERSLLGATHGEVGARLLGLWGFSDPVTEAVAFHQDPASAPGVCARLCAIVHVAHVAARCPRRELEAEQLVARGVDTDYLKRVGLDDRLEVWADCAAELAAH